MPLAFQANTVSSCPAIQSTWKLLKAALDTPVEAFQELKQISSPNLASSSCVEIKPVQGLTRPLPSIPWSAYLQRIGVCRFSTFGINSRLFKLFHNTTTLLLRGLGYKDLRMPAKLKMYTFPSLNVLKFK